MMVCHVFTDRNRVLAKFTEDSFAKVERLLELHIKYTHKVSIAAASGSVDEIDVDEDEATEMAYMTRLENGLYTLQLTDIIVACTMAWGHSSVGERVTTLFKQRNIPMSLICDNLEEYSANIGKADEDAAQKEKDFIAELVTSVQGGDMEEAEADSGAETDEGAAGGGDDEPPTPPRKD